jgi:hypothetical protein
MKKNLFAFLILFFAQNLLAQFVYEGLPPVTSVESSQTQFLARQEQVLSFYLQQPLAKPPTPPKYGFEKFAQTMIARMIYQKDLAAVSENLLTPSFKAWLTGTDIKILGKHCRRVGDYDFVMQSLIKMAYLDEEAGRTLLTAEARRKLRHELLYEKGVEHHGLFKLDRCIGFEIKDTENHILMTEISRYLTNQLLFKESIEAGQENPAYDNSKNGFNQWFLNHLSEFLRNDFDEFNSRPYQGFTILTLANLYSYAEDPKVKMTAQMILDYLSAKTAIQSSGLRRYPPFRRQKPHRNAEDLLQYDTAALWFAQHVGNYKFLELAPGNEKRLDFSESAYFPLMASAEKYRVPSLILDLFIHRPRALFQKMRHRDVEIYHSSPSFLLSSGGRFRSVFGFWTGQNDVWGVATTIIPKNYGTLFSQLFSISGNPSWNLKNNLCLAPNFACGENLSIPKNIPENCIHRDKQWAFYDLQNCSVKMGFYVATRTWKDKESGKNFAILEVQEPTENFNVFRSEVLRKNLNSKFYSDRENQYQTSDGHSIRFYLNPASLNQYPITQYDEVKVEIDTKKWPLADGDVLKSKNDGLIYIENPSLRQRLVLDGRDISNPRRYIESY